MKKCYSFRYTDSLELTESSGDGWTLKELFTDYSFITKKTSGKYFPIDIVEWDCSPEIKNKLTFSKLLSIKQAHRMLKLSQL